MTIVVSPYVFPLAVTILIHAKLYWHGWPMTHEEKVDMQEAWWFGVTIVWGIFFAIMYFLK